LSSAVMLKTYGGKRSIRGNCTGSGENGDMRRVFLRKRPEPSERRRSG
jgi:hypothetical protein